MTKKHMTPLEEELTKAYKVIVDHLRSNTKDANLLKNFEGTEGRCARALTETCLSDADIAKELDKHVAVGFPVSSTKNNQQGLVTQGPIRINSVCPHHLFPVMYEAYVSYIPKDGQVLGLSKLARMAKILGRRPVLQEQLASDIADVLCRDENQKSVFPSIVSNGSGVQLVGRHTCMCCRGVGEDALTSSVELRGSYWEDGMEDKFYSAIASLKNSNLM